MKIVLAVILAILFQIPIKANQVPPIRTVFVIVLENKNWSGVKGSTNAPYINNVLLPMASYCEQYYNPPGLHPSLPNYIWLESGTNWGIVNGADPSVHHQATTNHLVSQLNRAGIAWRTYQEDISGTYVPLANTNLYAVRHNPYAYFDDVTGTNNPGYAYGIEHIRPYGELAGDLTNNTVARYNFITPNSCHDGHDQCGPVTNLILQSDVWLSTEIPKILNSVAYSNNGALFITWDEGVGGSDGPIGMIVLSPLARGGGYSNNIHYTHGSALKIFQEIFQVGPLLGDAANATDLSDLFTPFRISEIIRLTNGNIQFSVSGTFPGSTNLLQASTDLVHWIPISTNVIATNQFTVTNRPDTALNTQFYRAVLLP